jgi:hypothetical protein
LNIFIEKPAKCPLDEIVSINPSQIPVAQKSAFNPLAHHTYDFDELKIKHIALFLSLGIISRYE